MLNKLVLLLLILTQSFPSHPHTMPSIVTFPTSHPIIYIGIYKSELACVLFSFVLFRAVSETMPTESVPPEGGYGLFASSILSFWVVGTVCCSDYPVRPSLARGFYPVNLQREAMGGMLSLRAPLSHSGSSERSIAGALSRPPWFCKGFRAR